MSKWDPFTRRPQGISDRAVRRQKRKNAAVVFAMVWISVVALGMIGLIVWAFVLLGQQYGWGAALGIIGLIAAVLVTGWALITLVERG